MFELTSSQEGFLLVVTAVLGFVALVIAVFSFRMKKGHSVRAKINISDNDYSAVQYVSEVLIENGKDKSLVIFGVYLRFGRRYFLTLEEFKAAPLIVEPFGVERRLYEPVDGYRVQGKRININNLLLGSLRKDVLLSTTDGMIRAKQTIEVTSPVESKNSLIVPIGVERNLITGRPYDAPISYLVRFLKNGKEIAVVPIGRDKQSLLWVHWLGGEERDFVSKDEVRDFVVRSRLGEELKPDSVEVIDGWDLMTKQMGYVAAEWIKLEPRSWFVFHVFGRLQFQFEELRAKRVLKQKKKTRRKEKRRLKSAAAKPTPSASCKSPK